MQPWIVVSGDGTQRAYIMKPLSQSPLSWDYSLEELINVENTVGGISVGTSLTGSRISGRPPHDR